MKKMIGLLVALAMFSGNVSAMSVQFDFDIFSSGSDIYACNAGLMHQPHLDRVCYNRDDSSTPCNPSACDPDKECACVCTGSILTGNHDGEYRLDYMRGAFAAWSDHHMPSNAAQEFNQIAGQSGFNQVVANSEAMDTELRSLSFLLGSERFGAVYFLDVCYRATQVNYTGSALAALNYVFHRQVTITDLTADAPYSSLSGLEVKSVVNCQLKNGSTVQVANSAWTAFGSSQVVDYTGVNLPQADIAGCKARYYFRESLREGLGSIRPWTAQEARVCTYTEVSEPALK